jgi:hypothetical protein
MLNDKYSLLYINRAVSGVEESHCDCGRAGRKSTKAESQKISWLRGRKTSPEVYEKAKSDGRWRHQTRRPHLPLGHLWKEPFGHLNLRR